MKVDNSKLGIRRRAESIKVRQQHRYRECELYIKDNLTLDHSVAAGIAGSHVRQVQQTRCQLDEDSRYQVFCKHDVTEQEVRLMAPHVAFFLAHGHWLFDEA